MGFVILNRVLYYYPFNYLSPIMNITHFYTYALCDYGLPIDSCNQFYFKYDYNNA